MAGNMITAERRRKTMTSTKSGDYGSRGTGRGGIEFSRKRDSVGHKQLLLPAIYFTIIDRHGLQTEKLCIGHYSPFK